MKAIDRQRALFLSGFAGKPASIPLHFENLESKARRQMTPAAFAGVQGGAGLGRTLKANTDRLTEYQLVPNVLRDVTQVNTGVSLFGCTYDHAFLLAPVGVLEAAHPEADRAVVAAAAKHRVPMIFSSQASVSMEKCANVMGNSPRWFQLYVSKSKDLVISFIRRAEHVGAQVLVITVDTTLLGWRVQDLERGYLPFMHGKGLGQYLEDPIFQQMVLDFVPDATKPSITPVTIWNVLQMAKRFPGNTLTNLTSGRALKSIQTFLSSFSKPDLTWDDIEWIRNQTQLPIVLKGIQSVADAKKAEEIGVDGIVVSNHGGRQLDGAMASIDALEAISRANIFRGDILFDSGIRGGADVVKACALGAKAVLVGRPYVYALACGGQGGVQELLENYISEVELSLALCGCSSFGNLNRDHLFIAQG